MSATRVGACQVMSCWRLAAEGMDFCEEHGWQELIESPPRKRTKQGRGELQRHVLAALVNGHTAAHSIAQTLDRDDTTGISAAIATLVRKGLAEKISYGTYCPTIEGREAVTTGRPLDAGRGAREKPAERQQPPAARVRVKGTGLSYRAPDEAYVAAEEIEADGVRVAAQARFDGDEGKAEKARDQSRELAEKIRDAAHAAEARAGHADPAYDEDFVHEKVVEPPLQEDANSALPEIAATAEPHLLVKPDEMDGAQRAYARALIAGLRAFADTLEGETAA